MEKTFWGVFFSLQDFLVFSFQHLKLVFIFLSKIISLYNNA